MKTIYILITALILCGIVNHSQAQINTGFKKGLHKAAQMKYPRVKEAYEEKAAYILNIMRTRNLAQNFENQLYIRVIKNEQCLEVWGRSKENNIFHWFTTYFFCSNIGDLGPKREEGDFQMPEGFYYIDRFNPESDYHLSMGINYPNKADIKKTTAKNPGSDIFIHGSCVTVGCVPIGDELIKELYIMVTEAINTGQTVIPVHIFPFRMTDSNFESVKNRLPEIYEKNEALWRSMQPAYQLFEDFYLIPKTSIDNQGNYIVKPSDEEYIYQGPATDRTEEETGDGE